ncbi:hypothetical protein U3516DRAFT_748313 [Neocallimastix sp. 'constans']
MFRKRFYQGKNPKIHWILFVIDLKPFLIFFFPWRFSSISLVKADASELNDNNY